MAQARHCPYSFYVPENDAQLMRFVKAQSNLSLSVRLLMKAFLSAYKGEIQDVAAADLSDLINGVRLENLPDMQGKPQPAAATKAQTEQTDDRDIQREEAREPDAHSAGAEGMDDGMTDTGTAGPAEAPASAMPDVTRNDMAAAAVARQEPPAQAAEAAAETAIEPDPVPEVEVEPERPVRTVGSSRTAYNQSRLPEQKATEDELMAMMGDDF